MRSRSKEAIAKLEDVLANMKPSEFKDNHLLAYKVRTRTGPPILIYYLLIITLIRYETKFNLIFYKKKKKIVRILYTSKNIVFYMYRLRKLNL